jgi:23S rRNA (cytidine2498-2'-O)-methyltransferase
MSMPKIQDTIYIADPFFHTELGDELEEVTVTKGNLIFSPQKKNVIFARDIWLEPQVVTFDSISAAIKILRAQGKFWLLNPVENIRRSHLIASELRKLPPLQHTFPLTTEIPAINCFSLLDKNTLVYSTRRWKKAPLGDYQFLEDKNNPPNRAYLKLWEALTLLENYPKQGDTVLDLGASPGGWTYVMQTFGAHVTAVDKAELAPHIAKLPNVNFLKQSAFALSPADYPAKVDWLLCDIACYPERTYELVQQWLAADKAKQMIFTIKLQGKTDFDILKKFQSIPNARVLHLFYNKHEATFIYPAPEHLWI